MSIIGWVSRVIAFIIALSISIPCFAVESMTNKGKPGVWMSEEEFDKVLLEKKELYILKNEVVPLLKLDIEKHKLLILQKDQEIKILDDIIKKKDELHLASIKLKQAEIDKLELRIEKFDKWYRSPSVYLISGVLLGGALSVGLSFGLNQ